MMQLERFVIRTTVPRGVALVVQGEPAHCVDPHPADETCLTTPDAAFLSGQAYMSALAAQMLASWAGLSRHAAQLQDWWAVRHDARQRTLRCGLAAPLSGSALDAARAADGAAFDAGHAATAVAFALMLRRSHRRWVARQLAIDLRPHWAHDDGDACEAWPDIEALLPAQPARCTPATERRAGWLLRLPQLRLTRQAGSYQELLALLAQEPELRDAGFHRDDLASGGSLRALVRRSTAAEVPWAQLDELIADVPCEATTAGGAP